MISAPYILVFDVESVGLHGEGYAFGYVVHKTSTGEQVEEGIITCPSALAVGDASGREWIQKHVDPHLPFPVEQTPHEVRTLAWQVLTRWSVRGAVIFVDWGWPVEARFLARCVDDDLRRKTMISPIQEIATVVELAGAGEDSARRPEELPLHNPLSDARHSLRILLQALARLQRRTP